MSRDSFFNFADNHKAHEAEIALCQLIKRDIRLPAERLELPADAKIDAWIEFGLAEIVALTSFFKTLNHLQPNIKYCGALEKNPIFIQRKNLTLLKIILIPNDFAEEVLLARVQHEESVQTNLLHFINNKSVLKNQLVQDEKFLLWWPTLSEITLKNFFAELNDFPRLQTQVLLRLPNFAKEIASVEIEKNYFVLSELINIFALKNDAESLCFYASLCGVRQVVFESYDLFFRDPSRAALDKCKDEIMNVLNGIQQHTGLNKNEQLQDFFNSTNNCFEQLSRVYDSVGQPTIAEVDAEFVMVEELSTPPEYLEEFKRWIFKTDPRDTTRLENKCSVVQIYKQTCADPSTPQVKNGSFSDQLISITSFAASSLSSLFSARKSSARFAPEIVSQSYSISQSSFRFTPTKLEETKNADEFRNALNDLLTLQSKRLKEIEPIQKRFVSNLLKRFLYEYSVKNIVYQMRFNLKEAIALK